MLFPLPQRLNPRRRRIPRPAHVRLEQLEDRAMLATFGSGDWGWAGALQPDNVLIQSIASDAQNNVLIAGHFVGSADFDMGDGRTVLSSRLADGFVAKYSQGGSLIWVVQTSGTTEEYITDMAVDAAGNVYLSGYGYGTIDFDPGEGVRNVTMAGGLDAFVWKLDSGGRLAWVKTFVGTGGYEGASAIAVDDRGTIAVAGSISATTIDFDPGPGTALRTAGNRESFVVRLSNSGEYLGSASFLNGEASDVAMDLAGNIIVTGVYQGTVDFDPGPGVSNLTHNNGQAGYVVKLTPDMNLVWARSIANSDYAHLPRVSVDIDSVYVAGGFSGTQDMDPTSGVDLRTASGDSWDAFVTRLTDSGGYAWTVEIVGAGTEAIRSISAVSARNSVGVLLAGEFSGTAVIQAKGTRNSFASSGSTDALFARISRSGEYVWARRYGGTGIDGGVGALGDSSAAVVLAGHFSPTTPVEFGPAAGVAALSGGDRPSFLMRLPNHAPTGVFLATPTLPRGIGSDAVVGLLSASDPDPGPNHLFRLVAGEGDDDNAMFTIQGRELRTAVGFQLRDRQTLSIRVEAQDQGGQTYQGQITLRVVSELPRMRLARVSGEGYARLAQDVYLEAGESYLATAVFDGDPSLFGSPLELWNSPSAVAATYEASSGGRTIRQATLVPAQTGMYAFLFALWDPGSVDVLSMSLVRASTGEELVANPFFARGISGWRSAGGVIEWLGGDRGLPVDRPVSVGSGTAEFEVVPRIGSERLVKNGDGTLILGQASASTGGVVVRAGELVVTNSQSLGSGGLWVRPGATIRFDIGAGDLALTALGLQDIGKVDLGQSRISLPAGAADVASVREAIKSGQKGWGPYQTYGLTTSQASPSTGRGLGYSIDGEGNLTVGYAAAGDGNLDGIVDIFDLSRFVAAGKFGQGTAAEWYEGDFNYDGTFNSLDLTQLVSGGLFQRGSYMAAPGALATGSEAAAANTASPRAITQFSAIDSFTWAAIATLAETDAPTSKRTKGSVPSMQRFAEYASQYEESR